MRRIQTPKVQVPPFLNNLYRDMRNRRLLFPALALVVALIAVPVALKTSSSTAPVAPTSAVGAPGDRVAEPAVLAEQAGVTNYRRRLEQLQTKNPFRKHFTALPKSAKLTTTTAPGTSSVTATSTTGASAGTTSATSPTVSSPPATVSGGTGTGTTSQPASGSTPTSPTKPINPNRRWFAYQASVAFGRPGNLTRRSHVKRLAFLPNDTKPIVSFLGVTQNAAKALFLISDDVSQVTGAGRCLPRRSDCKFLELAPGDEAKLKYAPEGDRAYKLKLLGMHLAPVHKPQGNGSGKRSSVPSLGPDG